MNKIFKKFSFTFLCFALIGCGNDNFKAQSELGGLRVLALSANTPEINSAATVTVTPLISYVDGGGATINYSWEACPDPGIDFGAEVSCDSSPASLKQSSSGSFNTNTLSASLFTGVATSISVVVSPAIFAYFASLDSDLQFNGVDYLVIVTYTDSNNGKEVTALKRIRLTSKAGGDLNTNPTFGGMLFNNSAILAYPTSEGDFLLSSTSAPQTYSQITNVGTKTFSEDMFISWYASSGEFLSNRTDVGEKSTFDPKGSSGIFVAVYRDGRGGVSFDVESF